MKKSHALATAQRTVDYVRIAERELRRLRRQVEQSDTAALAARTTAAHLRDENAALRKELAEARAALDALADDTTPINQELTQ